MTDSTTDSKLGAKTLNKGLALIPKASDQL
jgi:hypothetical protein